MTHATKRMARLIPLMAALGVGSLLPAAAWAIQDVPLTNGSFAVNLDGWQVEVSPPGSPPGSIAVQDGTARLTEGMAFYTGLRQTFIVPPDTVALKFRIVEGPSFSAEGEHLRDAFEAHVLRANGVAAVPAWRLGASAFYNHQEGEAAPSLGATTTVSGTVVRVPLTGIAAGESLTFAAALVGGDVDTGSTVRIDDVVLETDPNFPPIAFAGEDATFVCGIAGPYSLDGSYSYDPENEPMQYEWKDGQGVVVGTNAVLPLALAAGEYTFTLTVTDSRGSTDSDSIHLVIGNYGPGCVCQGLIGDINGSGDVNVSDIVCLINTALAYGSPTFPPGCVAGSAELANLNCQAGIDVTDVQTLILLVLGIPLSPQLDSNGDGCPDSCIPPPT